MNTWNNRSQENTLRRIRVEEVQEFRTAQVTDTEAATGCTLILCPEGSVCGVDVRGGAPGTRDIAGLSPFCAEKIVHAVLLSGGSAFGLDAAGGVMQCLEERRIGRDVGVTVVPGVCEAILFDLKSGNSMVRPDKAMGYEVCLRALEGMSWRSGRVGAGTGATVGKGAGRDYLMKGGTGCCVLQYGELYVGAIMAVNCVGDIYDPETGEKIAGSRAERGFGLSASELGILREYGTSTDIFSGKSENTIIGCLFTNAELDKGQAAKLASLGQNGIARVVYPAHTVFDGDTVFAMAAGKLRAALDAVGVLASHAASLAVCDAVRSAREDPA